MKNILLLLIKTNTSCHFLFAFRFFLHALEVLYDTKLLITRQFCCDFQIRIVLYFVIANYNQSLNTKRIPISHASII